MPKQFKCDILIEVDCLPCVQCVNITSIKVVEKKLCYLAVHKLENVYLEGGEVVIVIERLLSIYTHLTTS